MTIPFLLVDASIRMSRAFDRAAMSVAYGVEAADHYNEQYTVLWAFRDWLHGFCEGLQSPA